MKDLVEMYNYYRTQQNKTIEESFCLQKRYDVEDFNVSVITLFNWVRLVHKRDCWIAEGKPAKQKNLIIHSYHWCKTLRQIVAEEPAFSRYFMIIGDEITFSNSLTESERLDFCRKVSEELVVVRQDLYM